MIRSEVVGPIALRLELSTSAPDVDLFASLQVTDADGCIAGRVAARGWLRLSHRELDEDASTSGQPVHAHRRLAEVAPGERYRVDVEIWPAAFVVPKGGALVLMIQGIDDAEARLARHNDPDDRPSGRFAGWTTLHSDVDSPSFLVLPVVR